MRPDPGQQKQYLGNNHHLTIYANASGIQQKIKKFFMFKSDPSGDVIDLSNESLNFVPSPRNTSKISQIMMAKFFLFDEISSLL